MGLAWWQSLVTRWRGRRIDAVVNRRHVDDALWSHTLNCLPFLGSLTSVEQIQLRRLVSLFLDSKEFSGAQGLQVTDRHAVMVSVQACLPILHIAPADRPDLALAWYDSFVGIVLYPSLLKARRVWDDANGLVHQSDEVLSGEVMEGGPMVLAWSDVEAVADLANRAYNVVIHEFAHVMDLRDGVANGCPPMPTQRRQEWLSVMRSEFEAFRAACDEYARFGEISGIQRPLLDEYGASSVGEFFAVAVEAYFVQPQEFEARHPKLHSLFSRFFKAFA